MSLSSTGEAREGKRQAGRYYVWYGADISIIPHFCPRRRLVYPYSLFPLDKVRSVYVLLLSLQWLYWLSISPLLSGDLGCILASRGEVSCAVRVRGLHSLQLLLWWLFSAGARAFRGFPELQRLLRPQTFSSQLNRLSFLGDFGGNGFLLALIWRHGNSLRRKLLKVFLLNQTIFIPQVITYEGM